MVTIQSVDILKASDNSIELGGDFSRDSWDAHRYSDDHILLGKFAEHSMTAVGWCDTAVLKSILHGLVERSFSGSVFLKIDSSQKSLIFHNGQLVFARSDVMDDRLGEVIYRSGLITLEQMTDAAVEVTRDRKFGKVLLESKLFTSADLWNALKKQVLEIFQSIFLNSHVHYSIKERTGIPSISVVFESSTSSLIEESASFGQMFRSFLNRIDEHSKISVSGDVGSTEIPKEGTFYGDIVAMVGTSLSMGEYLSLSKLSPTNSYLAIFQLVIMRFLDVEDEKIVNDRLTHESKFERSEIKSLIDAYHITLDASRKAFEAMNFEYPLSEIQLFLKEKYDSRKTPLFLKKDGTIAGESVKHLYAKCRNSKSQYKLAVWELQSLIQFVLQITGDLLPGQGWSIKKSIQEMLE